MSSGNGEGPWDVPPRLSLVLWYNLLVKVFRNLYEALNSLERGKVLVSKVNYMFNPRLAFYQEDIFGGLKLDKYKNDHDLGYSVLEHYFSEFGIDFPKEEENDPIYNNLGLISSESFIVRSDDLLKTLEKIGGDTKDLRVLDKGPIDFVVTSGKILSSLSSSFDFLIFSSFKVGRSRNLEGDLENLMISGVYKGENVPDFSGFWSNILFGKSESYEKLLSVFDEDFRKYVLGSITFYDEGDGEKGAKYFSLPFGRFGSSEDTRFLLFEANDLGRKIGLVSIDQRLSSNGISGWFTRLLVSRRDAFPEPKIIGCIDLYYHSGLDLKDVVLIPVELDAGGRKRGRKILVLHTFLVGDLLDDYFKFYVDVRNRSPLYTDYILRLYPNKGREGGGKFVLDVVERVGFEIDGLDGANLSANLSFNNISVGELKEVGGNKELVPRGSTPKYDSLDIVVYNFSITMDEKLDLSTSSSHEEESLSLVRYRNSYILKGHIWNNKRFSRLIINGIEGFESKFLSGLSSSCLLSSEGEENLALRDKNFLLKMVDFVFRMSIKSIKDKFYNCVESGEKCDDFRLYVDIDEGKYGKDTVVITKIENRPGAKFIYAKVDPRHSEGYLKEIFENRALYSRFIHSFDEGSVKLCFENSRGDKAKIDIHLPLHEDRVKDFLKRKSYLGFINWSLRNLEEIKKDQADIYSVFLDLVPYDPSSVRFLHSKGIYDDIISRLNKFLRLEEALEQGTVEIRVFLDLGIKVKEKENRICILPEEGPSFIRDLTLPNTFIYKQGETVMEIEEWEDIVEV